MTDPNTRLPQDRRCAQGDHLLEPFDEPYPGDDEIGAYPADEVRKRWPRRPCCACGCICYESFTHYVAGDW